MAASISSAIFKPELLFYIIIFTTAFKLKSTGKQTYKQKNNSGHKLCPTLSSLSPTRQAKDHSLKYHLIGKINGHNTSSGFINNNEKLANMLFDICEHFKKKLHHYPLNKLIRSKVKESTRLFLLTRTPKHYQALLQIKIFAPEYKPFKCCTQHLINRTIKLRQCSKEQCTMKRCIL